MAIVEVRGIAQIRGETLWTIKEVASDDERDTTAMKI
jgi:hypothetical protein